MVTSPRSKRPRPPDLHTGTGTGLPATTGAPVSSGPTSGGFTPASATGGDDVFHQEDGEDGEDDEDEEESRGRKGAEKKAGRRKIKIEFIQDKSRRHITFSKRKAGIMKKAYELSTLTGTQVLLLVVSETGLVYTFTTAKLQPLVTQPEGKNLIQACLNAPNGTLPGGGPSGPGMPPPPPAPRSRANINLGMTGGTSPSHDAEGEDDGEGSADSPSMGSAKGRRRRRTNSSGGGAVPGGMTKALGSPSESLPATSPTLSMQQPHGGVSGGAAPYGAHHTAGHSPTLPQQHHHSHPHMGESNIYAYREGGAAPMMPYHHGQYGAMNAGGGMPSGLNAGSVPGGAIGQGASQQQAQQQSQMWMQQGNMPRR